MKLGLCKEAHTRHVTLCCEMLVNQQATSKIWSPYTLEGVFLYIRDILKIKKLLNILSNDGRGCRGQQPPALSLSNINILFDDALVNISNLGEISICSKESVGAAAPCMLQPPACQGEVELDKELKS